ncbi:MAG: response regulator [Desulfuromonadaceae bacterium]|nr:response regulator [Desulfuromonadaceae bacterium]MDD5105763.1 response regulator [Desulfuromonadaceae bacterium]
MTEKKPGQLGLAIDNATILVVDDDPVNLGVVRDSLVCCNYTILVAEDGESAIDRAEYANPDLILLDIMMPGIDGYETCRRLKASEGTNEIPVIFMTALAETGHKVKGLEAGAIDYITKPFQREELLARISVHLQVRELTKKLRESNETLEKRVEERTTDLAVAYCELEEEVAQRQITQELLQAQTAALEEKVEELQQTQNSLKKSERKFRTVFDQSFQLMGVLDSGGTLLEANQTSLDFCGVGESSVIGQPFWEGPWWAHSTEMKDKARNAVTRGAAGEFVRFEAIHLTSDGKAHIIDFSLKPVIDDQGSVVLLIPEGRDITELKTLEKELRNSQKMEAIGTLAAGIAHDFNNILMGIMGYTEMSLLKLDSGSPISQNLQRVHEAGLRAAELVQQILVTARRSENEMHPVHLSSVTNEVLKLLRATLPSTVEMRQNIPESGLRCMVMADDTQIHQVLMNLGTNASHAMKAKGGILSVILDKVDLDEAMGKLYGRQPGGYARLTVSDTGHGMDAQTLEKIFDPYFTTKQIGEGTGLGLAVVKGIIESHGGTILVDSEPGSGTTFQIILPLIENEPEHVHSVEDIIPTGNERILFVDDEESLGQLGKEMLVELGYTVITTTKSQRALDMFRDDPIGFDLVITDLTMPVMTGIVLARQIKAIRQDTPIILCTGYNEVLNSNNDMKSLFAGCLNKPYVISSLGEMVRHILDSSVKLIT